MNFEPNVNWRETVFVLLAVVCLLPFIAPPVALALGMAAALTIGNPFPAKIGKITKLLLQTSVVGLGFGMNIETVFVAGRDGILFAVATIFGTLALGYFLGKVLKIDRKISHLISSGTAICGGSAIAAVAPVIEADDKQISVSLGTIFILNSVALFVFPFVGNWLGLSEKQFGIWAAIAIQDTSSVVGAAARFGEEALQVATTVKLARALWIAPLALLTAMFFKSKNARITVPFFIFLFLAASVVNTYASLPDNLLNSFVGVARQGLTLTLFLIGAALSRKTLAEVGIKPMLQGFILWIVISVCSLWAVWTIL
ncbi:MAG: putative sulfate exporter family transporter [Acidobacteriota bacterium]|nr:putative sulfate exporter family transporter [Acidobacteriota bacterium]